MPVGYHIIPYTRCARMGVSARMRVCVYVRVHRPACGRIALVLVLLSYTRIYGHVTNPPRLWTRMYGPTRSGSGLQSRIAYVVCIV